MSLANNKFGKNVGGLIDIAIKSKALSKIKTYLSRLWESGETRSLSIIDSAPRPPFRQQSVQTCVKSNSSRARDDRAARPNFSTFGYRKSRALSRIYCRTSKSIYLQLVGPLNCPLALLIAKNPIPPVARGYFLLSGSRSLDGF